MKSKWTIAIFFMVALSISLASHFWGNVTFPFQDIRNPPQVDYLFIPTLPGASDVGRDAAKWAPKTPVPPESTSGNRTAALTKDEMALKGYGGDCMLPQIVRNATNSAYCLSCHDGTVSNAIAVGGHGNHPVGVKYPDTNS